MLAKDGEDREGILNDLQRMPLAQIQALCLIISELEVYQYTLR